MKYAIEMDSGGKVDEHCPGVAVSSGTDFY
jgi:hypothetical protein